MRVTLVIPPSPFLADERVFPSLGILKVAAVLEAAGVNLHVLDLSGVASPVELLTSYLQQHARDAFGLTSTTPQFPYAVQLVAAIREQQPAARVILGGPHVTMCYSAAQLDVKHGIRRRGTKAWEQVLEHCDVAVVGDGEQAIHEALVTWERVVNAGDAKSSLFLARGTLEKYPLPARHLIDLQSYHYSIAGQSAQSMVAQLGCPFACGFCGGRGTQSFRMTRSRSIDSVLAEVNELVTRYDVAGVMFGDDELNLSDKGFCDLLQALIDYQARSGRQLNFRGFVKGELFNARQAELMAKAGFSEVLTGIESGSRLMLDVMQKHTTPQINAELVRLAHAEGMRVKALMSLGHPGESRATIEESIAWVIENRPDDVDWTVITQYPGSPYFDHSVEVSPETWCYTDPKFGQRLYSAELNYAQHAGYYKGVPGSYTAYVWTDHLSAADLVAERDRAEQVSRSALGLPAITAAAALSYDHSMGQLPSSVLREALAG